MKLSREQMLDVINKGGSIFLNIDGIHKQFTEENLDEFPTVADLALGDKEAEMAARKELDEKLAELLAEKAKLEAKEKEVVKPAKAAKAAKAGEPTDAPSEV